jgi:probable rRNA maturation factor
MGISLQNQQRTARVETAWLRSQGRRILRSLSRPTAEVSVLLVDDPAMAELNRAYRGVAGPTDVLAFPMTEGRFGDLTAELLGDVVISVETAARQAGPAGLRGELSLLLAHGILHLLGYDHGTSAERRIMWGKQAEILAALGLPPLRLKAAHGHAPR